MVSAIGDVRNRGASSSTKIDWKDRVWMVAWQHSIVLRGYSKLRSIEDLSRSTYRIKSLP